MKDLARIIRPLLLVICLSIVAWSFFDVARRAWLRQSDRVSRPIRLTVLHWGDKAEDEIVETLVRRFEAEHPTVHIERINAGSGFPSKLKTMLAAGTPPDVFYLPPSMMPELATLKLLAPLDRQFAGEDPAWKNDIYPILFDAFRYDPATERTGSGPMWALPKDFTPTIFYVNVDLFNAAGVPLPYQGWSWDEYEAAMKKITALNGKAGFESRKIYGGLLALGTEALRNVLWTYGGEYFGKDYRDVTLDEPPAQAALEMIRRVRLVDRTVFNATGIAKDGGQEFFNGNIGCIGPIGRWMTPRYKDITRFKWDIVPMPHGAAQAATIFYTGWSMSAQCAHQIEGYQLLRFLCGKEGQIMQSELGLAVPCLQSVANSDAFLAPPGLPNVNHRAFLDALPYARIGQTPRQPEWAQIVEDRITKSIQLGQATTLESAKEIEAAWLSELNSPLRKQAWPAMKWRAVLVSASVIIALTVGGLVWRSRREKLGSIDRATERAGWLFISPWVIGFIALTLGPMVVSLILSFTRWSAMSPMTDAESVGLANYKQLVTADPTFLQSLKVTAYYVILAVPIGQIAALAIALLMNSKVRGIAVFRTIYFVPSVVSGVALAVLWLQIFNNDYGLLNAALRPIARLFGTTPPDWFGVDARRWAIPAFVIMGLWGIGGGMIIYLAGLKGIAASLYEAASIDGAGPIRKLWSVTLPQLSPLIFYNMVMGIIGSFQVFTQAYVMTGAGPDNSTLFYVLNLYRQAFEFHNMGYASAMAWVLFVIVLLLTVAVFKGSKNLVYYEGLK